MKKKKATVTPRAEVWVEYYRTTPSEFNELIQFVEESEAITGTGRVHRKGSGAVELGEVFTVYVLPVIATYAANKVLDIVYDRVKEWFKKRGKKDQFIRLNIYGQNKKRRQIGKGRPKGGMAAWE
jgi:hypothetical protein